MLWAYSTYNSTRSLAVSETDGRMERGTKWTVLEERSTMVSITVLPSDRDSSVTYQCGSKVVQGSGGGGADLPEV